MFPEEALGRRILPINEAVKLKFEAGYLLGDRYDKMRLDFYSWRSVHVVHKAPSRLSHWLTLEEHRKNALRPGRISPDPSGLFSID